MKLKGQIIYKQLEGGFWGIIDQHGKQFRPIHVPDQLKVDGTIVEVSVKPLKDVEDIFMWGEVVEITSFTTPG